MWGAAPGSKPSFPLRDWYEFVDFLKEAGQTYWQILPLGQTGYGDSPYQSFSTFAGNPYFIDPESLIQAGYIDREGAERFDFGKEPRTVDYEKIYRSRYAFLRRAYANSPFCLRPCGKWAEDEYDGVRKEFEDFRAENSDWLPDFALFSAVKEHYDGLMFMVWPEDIRLRKKDAMDHYRTMLDEEVRFYEFLQYLFAAQWKKLKDYANGKGIRIIGDIPIYVAFDSADTWSHPSTAGNITKRPVMNGGSAASSRCSAFTMLSGSIISADLTNTGQFLTEVPLRWKANGAKARVTNSLQLSKRSWANRTLLRRISGI